MSIIFSTAVQMNGECCDAKMLNGDAIGVVLFDLDGTLLDTAADMAAALNVVLASHGRAPLANDAVRPFVSQGGMALINLGFGLMDNVVDGDGDDDSDGDSDSESNSNSASKSKNKSKSNVNSNSDEQLMRRLYDELLAAYRKNINVHTRLFPGMDKLLAHIDGSQRRCGIVTNKPGFLTEPLLDEMNLRARMACVISGDTLPRRKPYPDQLLHACELIQVRVADAVYVGDDARDIECGKRAGMRTIAAAYGYIPPGVDPHAWGADAVIDSPAEMLRWLR